MKLAADTYFAAYLAALEALRGAHSKVAVATELFLAGKIEREELAHHSAVACAAERALNAAERAYRHPEAR